MWHEMHCSPLDYCSAQNRMQRMVDGKQEQATFPLISAVSALKEPKSSDLWDQVFQVRYGQRRHQLLILFQAQRALDASARARVICGENCHDFAKTRFNIHLQEGAGTASSLFASLEDLAVKCACEHPCEPDKALGHDEKLRRSDKYARMFGLGREALYAAAMCQIPDEYWNAIVGILEKIPPPELKAAIQDTTQQKGIHAWLRKSLPLLFQILRGNQVSQSKIAALLSVFPLQGVTQQLNSSDFIDCGSISSSYLTCVEEYPLPGLGIPLGLILIMYLMAPNIPILHLFIKKTPCVDRTAVAQSYTFPDGTKSKVTTPVSRTQVGDNMQRLPTVGSMKNGAYEKPAVVNDVTLTLILVLLIGLLLGGAGVYLVCE